MQRTATSHSAGRTALIIHRIVGGSARDCYVLCGDNRDRRDVWCPISSDVRGALVIGIPAVGAVLSKLRERRFLTAALAMRGPREARIAELFGRPRTTQRAVQRVLAT